MSNNVQNVKGSDTTGDDSSNAAGPKNLSLTLLHKQKSTALQQCFLILYNKRSYLLLAGGAGGGGGGPPGPPGPPIPPGTAAGMFSGCGVPW